MQCWQIELSTFSFSATHFPVHSLYVAIFLAPLGWPCCFQMFHLLHAVQLFLFLPKPSLAKSFQNIKASKTSTPPPFSFLFFSPSCSHPDFLFYSAWISVNLSLTKSQLLKMSWAISCSPTPLKSDNS